MTPLRYILFLCGQFGLMALARFLFTWILDYAKQGGDASLSTSSIEATSALSGGSITLFAASVVGLLMLGFRVFDALIDPFAGSFSDRWVARGRKRQNLLWFSFWVVPLGLVLVFAATTGMAQALRWVLLSAGLILFFIGYTFYAIPYWSLVADYSQGNDRERRILSALLGAGMLLATAAGFILSPWLVGTLGFFQAAIVFAVPAMLFMLGPLFAAPEPIEGAKSEAKASTQAGSHGGGRGDESMFKGLWEALKHRKFLAMMVLFAGSQMSLTIMTAAAPFIAVYLLGGTRGDVAFILGPLLLVAIPCFLFAPMISRRFGWLRPMVFATICLGIFYPLAAFLGDPIIGSAKLTAAILFACGGPFIAILLGLEGEAITACANERDPGLQSRYWGAFNFLVKALNGLALFIASVVVDRLPEEGVSGPARVAAVEWVRWMPWIAGGCLLVCLILFFVIYGWNTGRSAPSSQPS